jgi:hypothetical protein
MEETMKTLKTWQKKFLRSTRFLERFPFGFCVFATLCVSGSFLMNTIIFSLVMQDVPPIPPATKDWVGRIICDPYSLFWIIPVFASSLFLAIKFVPLLEGGDKYLPEVAAQEAEELIEKNPGYKDMLGPLVQEAIASDDGCKLAGKIKEIKEIMRLKHRLEIMEDEIEKFKIEINVAETKCLSE